MGESNTAKGDELRGEGRLRPIFVEADNLANAAHKAILACHDYGARVETPKHKIGGSLGYDAPILVHVRDADAEPKIFYPAMYDTSIGVMQYILEVTHGIHNHWKKSPEHPTAWGYTYNERFVDQIPFILKRIKAEWDEKKAAEGEGRITGRDYQFDIWRAGEDIILSQPDAPCFQRGSFRFLKNAQGEWVLNYNTTWRSRDLLKAWNQNNCAQVGSQQAPGIMRLFRDKVSDMLGIPIKLGSYNDYAESLHLYGLYVDRDNLEHQIEQMRGFRDESDLAEMAKKAIDGDFVLSKFRKSSMKKNMNKLLNQRPELLSAVKEACRRQYCAEKSCSLDDYLLSNMQGTDITGLKRTIAAQMDAEARGHGKQQSPETLTQLGYDLGSFSYPKDWDSWPSSWDEEPNPEKLARVLDMQKLSMGFHLMEQICEKGFASPDELRALAEYRGSLR